MTKAAPFALTPRTKPLRILSTSDWHLGNARVPAVAICDRLRNTLFPLLAKTDLLNIGGDIWDTLLSFSDETNWIIAFVIDLLRECDKHNVTVRILLGTYFHDRNQSSVFEVYHERCHFRNDLKYISQICLEEIPSLDLRILYLPDDLPYESSDACLEAVSELMTVRGWTYVDYVFGHGYFEHMLPEFIPRAPKCTFRIPQFKSFVRRYICMGHIHLGDHTGNVIYNNSFDRIAHGEEAPKGCVYIEDLGTSAKLRVIENKDATKFITIDLTAHTNKETVGQKYLDLLAEKFPGDTGGHVRVIHPSAEIRQSLHRLTTSRYPRLLYSFRKSPDEQVSSTTTGRKSFDVAEYPTPTKETLPHMVLEFLEKNGGTTLSQRRIAEILSDS